MDTALMQSNEHVGTPSVFSCPQCGGVLWELHDDELVRFRCRVGHAFSAESMLAEQNETLEEALWVALKAIEESVELSKRMAQQAEQRGQKWLVRQLEERYRDGVQRAALIKQALMKSEPAVGPEANNGPTATRSQKRKQS
jgi:two-component system chemotaxis response regulator CheB